MWFDRIDGLVDLKQLARRRVVVVGCGRMGSRIAWHLARTGVGGLVFVDGDVFEAPNVPGLLLPAGMVGAAKASALATMFVLEMPWTRCEAVPRFVDSRMRAREVYAILDGASLVVVATDDLKVQYRVNRAALGLGIPALFPGLYAEHGGEVFIALGTGAPCFECYSRFRPDDAPLRAVAATSHSSLAVEQVAVHLALGLLDPSSAFAGEIVGTDDEPAPRQLVTVASFGAPQGAIFNDGRMSARAMVRRRAGCPGCAAGARLARRQPRTRPGEAVMDPPRTPKPRNPVGWVVMLTAIAVLAATAPTGVKVVLVGALVVASVALVLGVPLDPRTFGRRTRRGGRRS